jgi:hypothetical protein
MNEPTTTWNRNQVQRAITATCSCGGRGPDDGCCQACEVWHRLNGREIHNPMAQTRADRLDALCAELIEGHYLARDGHCPSLASLSAWEKRRAEV